MRNAMPSICLKISVVLTLFMLSALSVTQAAERITYYHTDALGSPVAATDQQGNVVWRESYEPYGERVKKEPAASTNARWHTGHVLDAETGLQYAGARYYDPVIGRFMGVDPDSFTEKNPHSFNRYNYGNNNPYKFIDPDGRAGVEFQPGGLVRCAAEGGCRQLGGGGGGAATPRSLPQTAASPSSTTTRSTLGETNPSGTRPDAPDIIYRGGGSNPGNLKMRPDESAVSFRDSLSNPIDAKQRPVLKPGDQYIGVDTKQLPPGSVIRDNNPPGHVSVTATPENIRDAVVEKGRFPR